MRNAYIIFSLILMTLQVFGSVSGKIGYEHTRTSVPKSKIIINKTYVQFTGDYDIIKPQWYPEKMIFEGRVWRNFSWENSISQKESSIDLRKASLLWRKETAQITVGLQSFSWGENMGGRILDVVSPRDYSEHLFTDLEWSQIPVGMVKVDQRWGDHDFQWIYTPFPQNPLFPKKLKELEISHSPTPRPFTDAEYGVKYGTSLFTSTYLNLYYYNHLNRLPVYQIQSLGPPSLLILQAPSRVNTYGFSFNHPMENWIGRGDYAYDENIEIQTLDGKNPQKHQLHQAILGLDFNAGENIYGVQTHFMHNSSLRQSEQGVSLFVNQTFGKDQFSLESLYFHGLSHAAERIHFKLSWKARNNFDLSFNSEFLTGAAGDYFSIYEDQDILSTRMTYFF